MVAAVLGAPSLGLSIRGEQVLGEGVALDTGPGLKVALNEALVSSVGVAQGTCSSVSDPQESVTSLGTQTAPGE